MARQPDIQYIRLYTDGSNARKLEPLVPQKKVRLPRAKKQKRTVVHVDPIAIAGIIVAVVMLVLMVTGVAQLNQAQQQRAVMEQYVDSLRAENGKLQAEYDAGYDLEEIERTALALGLVPKNQVQQILIEIPAEQVQEESSAWEQIYAFLTGLFA